MMECRREENKENCACTHESCDRHGVCCECLRESLAAKCLPECLKKLDWVRVVK